MKLDRCPTRRAFFSGLSAAGLSLYQPAPALAADREFRRGGMIYRPLGKTGLNVSLLSFGSHTNHAYKRRVGRGNVLTEEGQALRDRRIAKSMDLGVNLFDVYESEGQWQPLARLVNEKRSRVHVSTSLNVPEFLGKHIDRAAKMFGGYVDLYRIGCLYPKFDPRLIDQWEILRRAKEAGKVRAIGVATHMEQHMMLALKELDGLDYIAFPYNFIHARADYSEFLPAAIERGVGLVAIKPLAAGSIAQLDSRSKKSSKPDNPNFHLFTSTNRAILPAVVAELTKTLNRLEDETLCQAALRFVFSKKFISCAWTGMFDEQFLDENYAMVSSYSELSKEETAALGALRKLVHLAGTSWLPRRYEWLHEEWSA